MVNAASRIVRAISLGVFWRLAPSTSADHPVEEAFSGVGRDPHHEPVGDHAGAAGHRAAVAARFPDHRRALAGDRALVHQGDAGDDLAVGRARRRRPRPGR